MKFLLNFSVSARCAIWEGCMCSRIAQWVFFQVRAAARCRMPMIAVSQNAVKHLRELLESRGAGENAGLRLAVHRGGCAGMEYVMKVDEPTASDRVFDDDGVSVIVDEESLQYLDGCRLDYVEALNDSGFKVENPNASRSCGCGTSFEPKPGAA
jgi:iron-sulfur cluster assembly accessory protein